MTISLKSAIKQICSVARLNEAAIRIQADDVLVLCYHGVVRNPRPEQWSYENWVDAASFRSQLRWLKEHFSVCDLTGFMKRMRSNQGKGKPAVLITFDDGYRNNLTVAAPILRDEAMPAVFFLATGYIGGAKVLWNEEVRIRVMHWPEPELRMPHGETATIPGELQARKRFASGVDASCKQIPIGELSGYLEYLRSRTPSVELMDDPEAREFLTWNEAKQLAALGFDIGSHTVRHPILSRIDRARLRTELTESKATLERELGRPCEAVAYPNGSAADVSEDVFEEVPAAGYRCGFMTTPEWQKPGGDPYRIPRIAVPGHADFDTFRFHASGLRTRIASRAI